MRDETWRQVADFPSYMVSDHGRIMRIKPYATTFVGKVLKPYPSQKGGHLMVRLCEAGQKAAGLYVHRLVAFAFIGPKPNGDYEVAHDDGNPLNNVVGNLAWKTSKENTADRVRHGTDQIGERNPNIRLSDLQVRLVRARYHVGGEHKAALARLFGVSEAQITRIISNKQRASAGGYASE